MKKNVSKLKNIGYKVIKLSVNLVIKKESISFI